MGEVRRDTILVFGSVVESGSGFNQRGVGDAGGRGRRGTLVY